MVEYEPKNWLGTLLRYRYTALPHVLPRVTVLTAVTALYVLAWYQLDPDSDHADILAKAKPTSHSLIGVALGLLIVFRNNASYDRFWEGRKLWGSIINTSRSLIRGVRIHAGPPDGFDKLLAGYVWTLKAHLNRNGDYSRAEALLPSDLMKLARESPNPPAAVAEAMSAWIAERHKSGRIDSMIVRMLEGYVHGLVDCQGGCERILKTPIPFAYAVHIKQLLTIYLLSLPIVLVPELHWWAVPAVAAISFGMLGIEDAGVEIEDPFGEDPNDLPLVPMSETVAADAAWGGRE